MPLSPVVTERRGGAAFDYVPVPARRAFGKLIPARRAARAHFAVHVRMPALYQQRVKPDLALGPAVRKVFAAARALPVFGMPVRRARGGLRRVIRERMLVFRGRLLFAARLRRPARHVRHDYVRVGRGGLFRRAARAPRHAKSRRCNSAGGKQYRDRSFAHLLLPLLLRFACAPCFVRLRQPCSARTAYYSIAAAHASFQADNIFCVFFCMFCIIYCNVLSIVSLISRTLRPKSRNSEANRMQCRDRCKICRKRKFI